MSILDEFHSLIEIILYFIRMEKPVLYFKLCRLQTWLYRLILTCSVMLGWVNLI